MKDLFEVLKHFFPFFKDYKWQFFIAIIGTILAAAGTAASAWMIKPVLNDIFIAKKEELLYILSLGIVLVYVIKELGTYTQAYFTAYIGQDIVRRFRDDLVKKLLLMHMDFFYKFRTGELISRTINDIDRIRNVVSNMIPSAIKESLSIIGLLGVVIYQSPKLSVLALVILPLALYPLSCFAKKLKKISFASQEKNSDITAKLSEIFNNIEVIKANNAHEYEFNQFKTHNEKFFHINVKSVKISQLSSPMMEILGSFGVASVIIIGGKEVINGSLDVGSFFSFLAALFMLYTPVKRLSKLYNDIQDAVAAGQRTFYLLNYKNQITSGKTKLHDKISNIYFENITLKYDEKIALNNINLNAKKGDYIAFVGESGGGKTSMINLILRFYDPSSGEIKIDGINIKNFTLESLRSKIAYVPQRIYIFNDSVKANVAYGREIDDNKVIAALKKANAFEFVENLPNGIDSILDEFGTNLSGGQRQRIAIARALYLDPEILIFDEATSALDNESEKEIIKTLFDISKDRITFIIAHRLSTIKNANKIAFFKQGQICDIGTFDELLSKNEDFRKLNNI